MPGFEGLVPDPFGRAGGLPRCYLYHNSCKGSTDEERRGQLYKEVIREHKPIVEALSVGYVDRTKEAIKVHLINSKLAALGRNTENKDVVQD